MLGERSGPVLLVRDLVTPCRGSAVVAHVEQREVRHEAVRGRAVPVVFARLEEDPVSWTYDLDRATTALCQPDAFEDVDRLSVGVGVPRRSRARCEMHAACTHARGARGRSDGVNVDRAGEPI